MTPEDYMKQGFESFFKARECFEKAIPMYAERKNEDKGDRYNVINVEEAIRCMALAYDNLSEIWENDIDK
jgi:hypothetical protein